MLPEVMGVDAAAGQWLAVVLRNGAFSGSDLRHSLRDLIGSYPDVAVVAVDIPIGLPTGKHRRLADHEARVFVGGARAASVFWALPSEVLEPEAYDDAAQLARRLLGVGLSRQSYSLRARILEAAELMGNERHIVEVHPEVSFRALKGSPLRYSKHSWGGISERRTLLASAGIELPDDLVGGGLAAPDDVVDAAAAAWSALRVARGQYGTLPSPPSTDPAEGGAIYF